MSDYDRDTWQAEQSARDEAETTYRDKMARARERSAANAKRKVARLHAKLTELGHISEFEDEFGESILERLDKFGSAFNDLEKGRPGDALSIAQKQVVARMNRKVKELKSEQKYRELSGGEPDPDAEYVRTADRWKSGSHKTSSFKSKRKPKFQPRVRHIEDEKFEDAPPPRPVNPAPPTLATVNSAPVHKTNRGNTDNFKPRPAPYIPEYVPGSQDVDAYSAPSKSTTTKRPFLRLVSNDVKD